MIGELALSRTTDDLPHGWCSRNVGRWWIKHPHNLPAVELLDNLGRPAGWLIGYALSPDGEMLDGTRSVVLGADRETSLYAHGGRFIAVLLCQGEHRLYLDAAGALPLVFDPEQQAAASTPALLFDGRKPVFSELARRLDIPRSDHWLPFGLTPIDGVRRLLPNHYLSLDNWRTVRHWPGSRREPGALSVDRCAKRVGDIVKRHMSAIASRYRVNFALTAGRESRFLLACSRAHLGKLTAFTVPLPDRMGRKDALMAPKLARVAGIPHRQLEYRVATRWEQDDWLNRTGRCVAGRTLEACAVSLQLPTGPDCCDIGGIAGEAGRAFYWRPDDREDTVLTPNDLVRRMRLPALPELTDAAAEWLACLPGRDTLSILDLAYTELRVGCWSAPMSQGNLGNRPIRTFWPLAHRECFAAWLRLSPAARRESSWVDALIGREWPELLEFPFNRLPWRHKVYQRVKQTLGVLYPT